jgi:hypothetical protein
MRSQELGNERILKARRAQNLENLEVFVYNNVINADSDYIRLLRLKSANPGRGNDFELRTFRLKHCPSYFALSYAWGSVIRDCPLCVDGKGLFISSNLLHGLNELECISQFANKWFWVDQICINQEDVKERSHQVKLMSRIYRNAQSTVVWLGCSDGPKDEGFNLARQIYDLKATLDEPRAIVPGRRIRYEDELQEHGLPCLNNSTWDQLEVILSSDWFSRLWVIQEAFLSQKDPMVVYSFGYGRLRSLVWTGAWIGRNIFPERAKAFIETDKQIQCIHSMAILASGADCFDFTSAVLASRAQDVSDPKDRIYALYGITRLLEDDKQWPKALIPNYEKPVEQIYREIATYYLASMGDLSLLSLVNLSNSRDSALSWVPLFNSLPDLMPDAWVPTTITEWKGLKRSKCFHLKRSVAFRASGDRLSSVAAMKDPNLLVLKGVKIETVDWVTGETEKSMGRFFLDLEELIEHAKSSDMGTFCHIYLEAVRSLRAITGPRERSIVDLWDFVSDMTESIPNLIYFVRNLKRPYNDMSGNADLLKADADKYGRGTFRWFISSGKHISIGPGQIKPGDVICVFFGCSHPFVLRPAGDSYRLVGGCFIQHYMDGVAIDMLDKGQLQEEWFTLS